MAVRFSKAAAERFSLKFKHGLGVGGSEMPCGSWILSNFQVSRVADLTFYPLAQVQTRILNPLDFTQKDDETCLSSKDVLRSHEFPRKVAVVTWQGP